MEQSAMAVRKKQFGSSSEKTPVSEEDPLGLFTEAEYQPDAPEPYKKDKRGVRIGGVRGHVPEVRQRHAAVPSGGNVAAVRRDFQPDLHGQVGHPVRRGLAGASVGGHDPVRLLGASAKKVRGGAVAVDRKNWLFCDTVRGAKASAVIYSLIETAKANNLLLKTYMQSCFKHDE